LSPWYVPHHRARRLHAPGVTHPRRRVAVSARRPAVNGRPPSFIREGDALWSERSRPRASC
jgi:hypothetical protein